MPISMSGLRWRKRRGVSPLVATIILIAITLAAGLTVYNLFFSVTSPLTATVQIMPEVELIRPGGATTYCLITVTVKNTGSVAIQGIEVRWVPEGGNAPSLLTMTWSQTISSGTPLPPGAAIVGWTTVTTGTMPIVGKPYPFIINVTAVNGASYLWSGTVTCQG